jgi:hypothetical protein
MRTNGRFQSSLPAGSLPALLTVLAMLAVGCGLGTEIGNGKKPKDGKSPTPAANDDGGSDGTDDEAVDDQTEGVDGVSSPNTGNVGTDGAMDGGETAPQTVRDGEENRGFDFDLAALAASCGSPFAALEPDKDGELVLTRTDAGATDPAAELRARLDSGAWILATNKDLFEVTPNPSAGEYAVTAKRVDGTGPVNTYTCGKVTLDTASISGRTGTFARATVALDGPGGAHKVRWFTQTGASDAAELVRISVELESLTGGASTVIVLDVAP